MLLASASIMTGQNIADRGSSSSNRDLQRALQSDMILLLRDCYPEACRCLGVFVGDSDG